jgi:glucan phosphoethanolaminetransferase (alkaline phosphatase superfamily)
LLRFPAILIFALIFALVTFGITQLPVAAVAIGACASIAGLTPRHNRSRPPSRLGPFFSFLTGALAVVFLFVMTGYFVTGSTGAFQVLEAMRLVDKQEATRQTLLGIALIILSVLCLAAPMWAFAQRIRTPAVLSQGLKRFGAAVAVVGLVLGVVASPVAIYFDRHLQDTLYRLVVNEPYNYYLIRTR